MEKLNITECKSLIEQDKLSVIFFKAEWASDQCGRVRELLNDMREYEDFQNIVFVEVEAEEVPDVCMEYEIAYVPAVLFFRKGKRLDRVDGFNASLLTSKVKHFAANPTMPEVDAAPVTSPAETLSNGKPEESELDRKLKVLVNKHDIMLFMKGDRNGPRCGFSNTIIQLLNQTGLDYETFDILEDEEVRQGLKEFSNWQTYPQLYYKGELVGGLDIVKELHAGGELLSTLTAPANVVQEEEGCN